MADLRHKDATPLFEAEVIPGLESCVISELHNRYGAEVSLVRRLRAGFVRFRYDDQPTHLRALRSVIAVYQVHYFPIPRPKAFLGHEHFTRLTKILTEAMRSFSRPPRTLGIGAAGARSSIMQRLFQALLVKLNLEPADDGKGELYIRILPDREKAGWELLARLSHHALSARAYRVANMPGSLNATVAYAMTQLETLHEYANVVNLCSGASTILIEHALLHNQHRLVAIDCSESALKSARRNTCASGLDHRINHIQADARRTPLPQEMADLLYADLPFGHCIGSHEANLELYPSILREAARLASSKAAFIVLTHEVTLLRQCLKRSPWQLVSETRINLRGLHPRLFVLRRISTRI